MATLEQQLIGELQKDIADLYKRIGWLELRYEKHLEGHAVTVDQAIGTVDVGAVVTGLKVGRIE